MSATPAAPTPSKSPTRIGLVLSGGGARGAFQVGVWEVLWRDPRGLGGRPAVISGTSAGALNGALIAAGLTPEEMLDFWLDLARRPPVAANSRLFRSLEDALVKLALYQPVRPLRSRIRTARILGQVLRKQLRFARGSLLAGAIELLLTGHFDSVSRLLDDIDTGYLFDTGPLRKRLMGLFGGASIENPLCRLAINTVDVRSGQVVRFVSHRPQKHAESDASHYRVGPIPVDAVLASASIPLLFNPIGIGQNELWDGGLLVNTPIAPTVALGATRIIPVLVTAGSAGAGSRPLTLGDAVERLADAFLENAYNNDRKLLLERNKLAVALPARNLRVVKLYEAIRPASSQAFNAGSYLYFEPQALLRMYEAGRQATRAWLDAGPHLDRHPGAHLNIGEDRAPLE